MRASGVSTWRFLSPVAALALLFGIFTGLILGPGASRLNAAYEARQVALMGNVSVKDGAGGGRSTWTRDRGPQQYYTINYLGTSNGTFTGVTLYTFDIANSVLVARFDAATATRNADAWVLSNVSKSSVGVATVLMAQAVLPLNQQALQGGSTQGDGGVKAIPIWDLPAAAHAAALSGGSPQKYWLVFHRKLALAMSGLAPSWVAAWSPPLAALFIAMTTVSFREDG
jgi:lipopolysaccharide export system permease protein